MIEQGNRTQQLIYRASYRKHKERLADIRHNVTANDFLPPRNHHSAKRHFPKERIKKDEIQSTNLKVKIGAANDRTNPKLDELFSTEQLRKEPKRYFDHGNEVKIKVSSEMNNGDHINFILPSQKNPSASFNIKAKDNQKVENSGGQLKMSSIQKSYKKFSSNSVLKDTQRDPKTAKQADLLYNLPERNQYRVVVYKKTLVFTSMQSCMLELSLINQRLLIAAYLMGLENSILRQLYSLKRTSQILKQCNNNYEQLCSRISVEKVSDKYQLIKINPKQQEEKIKDEKDEDKSKQRAKIQTQFIKRNYYTLVKPEQQQKEQHKQKLPSYSFDHVQAIVERLAAPKRFFKAKDDKLDNHQRSKAVTNYQKQHKANNYSHQEVINSKRQPIQSKQSLNSIKKGKQVIPHKQPLANQKSYKIHQTQKIQTNKSNVTAKQQNNQNYEQLYEQQFDNPSQVKNSNLHSLQKLKPINGSLISNKQKDGKIMKQLLEQSNNNSDVYKNEFQNQDAVQQYQQQFQNPNETQSPIAKIGNNSSLPPDNVEQQYADQFAD